MQKRLIYCLITAVILCCTVNAHALKTDWFNCLHGSGAAGCLDSWDGSVLFNGDIAVVIEIDNKFMCYLDADSAATEVLTGDSPIVAPHTNAGDKRWLCRKTGSLTGVLPGNWSDDSGDFRAANGARITHSMGDVVEFNNDGSVPTVAFLSGVRVLGLPDEQFSADVDPQQVYDNNSAHSLTLCERVNANFTVERLMVVCNIDPGTELTVTFAECAAGVGCGSQSTIHAVTTVNGVANITGGFTDAAIAAGNKIIAIFSDPDDAIDKVTLLVEGIY